MVFSDLNLDTMRKSSIHFRKFSNIVQISSQNFARPNCTAFADKYGNDTTTGTGDTSGDTFDDLQNSGSLVAEIRMI